MARVTKRDMFTEIATVLETVGADEALVEFVDHQIEMLDKRKSAPRKPTADQLKNEGLKDSIVSFLPAEGMTATEIANTLDVTVQKTSQLLRQLVNAGEVIRIDAKGKEKARFLPA